MAVTGAQAMVAAERGLDESALQAVTNPAVPAPGGAGPLQWITQRVPDPDPQRPLETWMTTVTWSVRRQTRTVRLAEVRLRNTTP